jgi:hypothetical protein
MVNAFFQNSYIVAFNNDPSAMLVHNKNPVVVHNTQNPRFDTFVEVTVVLVNHNNSIHDHNFAPFAEPPRSWGL